MSWRSLIIIHVLLISASVITTRALARDKKAAKASFAMNAAWFAVLYITGLLMVPWLGAVDSRVISEFWLRLIAGGTAFALTNVFTYKVFTYLDSAVGSVLSTLNAVFTVVLASLALNEDLSVIQAAGAIVLFFSITYGLLATRSSSANIHKRAIMHGTLYATIAAIFFSLAVVNEKWLLGKMPVADYLVFGWGGQALMAVLFGLVLQPKSFRLLKDFKITSLVISNGILRALAGFCFILSQIRSNNVGLVTVISNFRLIVVVMLGAWVLNERQKIHQKILASSAAILALAMMFH